MDCILTLPRQHAKHLAHVTLNKFLSTSDNAVTHLGTTLTGNVTDHIDTRIQSARRAYYGLQGAGVCCDGVAPKTLSHIYKVAIQPILYIYEVYGVLD